MNSMSYPYIYTEHTRYINNYQQYVEKKAKNARKEKNLSWKMFSTSYSSDRFNEYTPPSPATAGPTSQAAFTHLKYK